MTKSNLFSPRARPPNPVAELEAWIRVVTMVLKPPEQLLMSSLPH